MYKLVYTSRFKRDVKLAVTEYDLIATRDGSHWKIRFQDDSSLTVIMPCTSSDRRSMQNSARDTVNTFF